MGDYSELYFLNSRTPPRQGELDGSDSPYLLSKYHVPLFWLALFESEDIVAAGAEGWPYLVKARTEAATLLHSRRALLQRRFPRMRAQWHEQFERFLNGTPFEYVHLDTSQIGGMTGSAEQWRTELEAMLRGMFTEPAASRLSSLLGALNARWAPNPGWELFKMRLGPAFEGDRGERPWPYCGESGTDEPMPWDDG